MTFEVIDPDELESIVKTSNLPSLYPRPQIPVGYIKFMDHEGRCQDGYKYNRCHTRTNIYIAGIPYCITHAITKADHIIVSLTKQLKSLNVEPDYSFCCGDPEDCNERCNGIPRMLKIKSPITEAST